MESLRQPEQSTFIQQVIVLFFGGLDRLFRCNQFLVRCFNSDLLLAHNQKAEFDVFLNDGITHRQKTTVRNHRLKGQQAASLC
jgi:hypothetical protein